MTNKPKRRFLRFSVRTLLIVLTIGCIALGWEVERARRQREVVAWVHQLGGSVHYDYELDDKGQFDLNAAPPGPKWSRDLIGVNYLADVVGVVFHRPQVGDVSRLSELEDLRLLVLDGAQIRDLSPLARLASLDTLFLRHTQVRDVTPLYGLARLELLDLRGAQVSRYDVRELQAALPKCQIIR